MSFTPEARAAEIEDLVMASDLRKDAEDKEAEKKKADAGKADADAGEKLDKLLTALDGLNSRFDAISSRMDAYEAKRDGAEAAEMDKKKRKDAEEEVEEKGNPKEMVADSRSDSGYIYQPSGARVISDEQRDAVASIQVRADAVCSSWGTQVDRPMQNELPDEYLRRTARKHQTHSARWKEVNLRELSGQALKNATDQIFADSMTASCAPDSYPDTLREVRRVNRDTGHVIREFYGQPMAWMAQFTGGRRLAKFNLKKTHHD